MIRLFALTVAVLAAGNAASADFIEGVASEIVDGPTSAYSRLRFDYYDASRSGQRHSLESIRDFKMVEDFKVKNLVEVLSRPYFKLVLPYFYEGTTWSSEFVWTSQMVEIVEHERDLCLTKKTGASNAYRDLQLSYQIAPVYGAGQRVLPKKQIAEYESWKEAVEIICMGVDPASPFNGNQVWLSMKKSVKIIKGKISGNE
jgi:hypothetical protein